MSEYIDTPASTGTNRSAPVTDCATCGGDRFITVRLRSPEQTMWMKDRGIQPSTDSFHEEVAPCYTCNRAAYETLGRKVIDPALAEQLHTQ